MTVDSAPATGLAAGRNRPAGMPEAVVLICATVLPIMGIVSLAPVLPKLLEHFKATPGHEFLVPAALTIPALCIALFSAPVGVLADRFGRRSLLMLGLLLYAAFGILPLWLDSLHAIVASRAGLGLAEAVIMTTTTTLAGDYYTPRERQKWIAFQAAIGSLAASVLFAAGGALGQISWRMPFLLYLLALPIMVAVAVVLWEPKSASNEPGPRAAVQESRFPWGPFSVVLAFTFFGAVAFYVTTINLGRMLTAIGITEPARIGMATGLGSLGVPVGAMLYRKLAGVQMNRLLALSLLLIGVPLAAMGQTESFGVMFALFFVNQIGCGVVLPALINWCLSHLVFQWRGRGVGIWNSVFFIAQFLTPIFFTLVAKGLGSVLVAATALGIAALAVAMAAWLSGVKAGAVEAHAIP